MEIGARIKVERQKHNLTQSQLAEKLNVSRSAVSGWEVGRNYPDLRMIVTISDLFGLSLDELLREENKMITKIDRQLKFSKVYKVILVVLVGLSFAVGVYGSLKNYQTQRAKPIPITNFSQVEIVKEDQGDQKKPVLVIKGAANLAAKTDIWEVEQELYEGILYLAIYQRPTLLQKSHPQKFEFQLNNLAFLFEPEKEEYADQRIKKIILVSGDKVEANQNQQINLFAYRDHKIIYEN